uniref:ubiquinone biosynthesis accessory factor UbiJ n=1 Tax=Ningiella ruwaisensis TaxID=2364274 RepID=UPI00109FC749|nr:SCP2 sterol-binding domain-containing protein [Ningiella ruwaisensis]
MRSNSSSSAISGISSLLGSLIETSVNQAIRVSVNGQDLIEPLEDKRCILFIQELEQTLAFQFSNTISPQKTHYVDVLFLSPLDQNDISSLSQNECYVSISLFALSELKDTSKLTKLIKEDKLDFYGDLGILQKVSKVFSSIEFDLEETLSAYIGDAGAYNVLEKSKAFGEFAQKQHQLFMQTLSDAALEEKPIAVRPIMVANFVDEVRALKTDAERLEAKLNRYLERTCKDREVGKSEESQGTRSRKS